jgi:thiopeptide-type bacteriocin biosynthesis protein
MEYHFSQSLILRTPFFSYEHFTLLNTEKSLSNPLFLNALFLANPEFYQILSTKQFLWSDLNPRERTTIIRYYNRISYRPTPFGSFASFNTVTWGDKRAISLSPPRRFKLHINIDHELSSRLANHFTSTDTYTNFYCANPAIYKWGKDFRFIKTSYSDDKKKLFFDLESIEHNKLTHGIFEFLDGAFKPANDIIAYIIALTDCDALTAGDYLVFLISANILMAKTAANIIGEDHLERVLKFSNNAGERRIQELISILAQLKAVQLADTKSLMDLTHQLRAVVETGNEKVPKQFFYAGLEGTISDGELSREYQIDITNGLKALSVLVVPQQQAYLNEFIKEFRVKYDKQKVPLLQALDPDIGIRYGSFVPGADIALLRDVKFQNLENTKSHLEWSMIHRVLLSKWNSNAKDTDTIHLEESDITLLSPGEALAAPQTLSVMFRVTEAGVYMESVGGITATALIGRFAAWSDDIFNLSHSLAEIEESANPNVIFADIGQLSDPHADNINRRPHSYRYEIPVNVVSTLPVEKQIPLSDLWISVIGNQLILESKSLDKVIVPRLSSAYNYNRNQLSIFRFLCDMQYQGIQGSYAFSLENFFPGMPNYPRVMYKGTVLCAAIWHLSAEEVKRLNGLKKQDAIQMFKVRKEQIKLPAMVALSRFDQQLVFNTENDAEIGFLLDTIKSSAHPVVLQEYLLPDKVVVDYNGRKMVNQFLASLYHTNELFSGVTSNHQIRDGKVKSDFILGSKWLYLKLYCNPATSNDILSKKLLPFIKQLDEAEVQSWFFIRYQDTGYHIRLRLKIREKSTGGVLRQLKNRLKDTINYHLIREYQADTYRREMERYGADIIELVEDFFGGSSELVLRYINRTRLKSFKYSYHSLAFVSVEHLLQAFITDINDQIEFLEQMVNMFYSEFSLDKSLKIDLDQKYREIKTEISGLLSAENYYNSLDLDAAFNTYSLRTAKLAKRSSSFGLQRKTQLLADLIHMHLNRLFVDRPRNQELVVYYALYKYHLTQRALLHKRS